MIFRMNEKADREAKMMPFQGILERIIDKYNLREPMTVEALRAAWPDVVGDLAINSCPADIKDGTLYIKTNHPIISNEIIMMKTSIMNRFNEKYRADIRDIRTHYSNPLMKELE
jgi:hypothetical protein